MGAENRHGARRHILQGLDEARALRLERFDDMTIVNDLVAHVDRGAMLGQRPFHDVDRPNDPSAKSPRLGKNDLHSPDLIPLAFSSEPDGFAEWRHIPTHEPVTNSESEAIRRNPPRDKTLARHLAARARRQTRGDLSGPLPPQGAKAAREGGIQPEREIKPSKSK
jgi:hypothetical protein